jgi:hypothetical protein
MKTTLIFCEGPHDVSFVQKTLKYFWEFEKVEWNFSEYPAPFNLFFKNNIEKYASQDLNLDMAHKFFLPDRVMIKGAQVVMVFNLGGKDRIDKVKTLISGLNPLLKNSSVFPQGAMFIASDLHYLFLFDADDKGAESIRDKIKQELSAIDDLNWLTGTWITEPLNNFAAHIGNKAIYIWGNDIGYGTIEDIILPIVETNNKELFQKVSEFINSNFRWDVTNENKKKSVAETAKMKKAIITSAGQRKKPGSSMAVVIDQSGLIERDTFISNENVKKFAKFLSEFAGFTDSGEGPCE